MLGPHPRLDALGRGELGIDLMAKASPQTDRLIAAPPSALAAGNNLVWLSERRVEGGKTMKDLPAVAANAEGLILLQEMALATREMREDIGEIKTVQAEARGANLPGVVAEHAAAIKRLETQLLTMTVAARPGQFAVKELAKSAIGALVAALATLAALGKLHP